jgi:ribosomal protein S18
MTKIANQEVDYSTWRQSDVQSEIDAALDSGDYEKVKMLSQYLKEGKEIYLREIERINENHKFHDRRRNNIVN